MQIEVNSNRPQSTPKTILYSLGSLNRDYLESDLDGLAQGEGQLENVLDYCKMEAFMHTAFEDFCISDRLQIDRPIYHIPLNLAENESIMEAERCIVDRFRKVAVNDNFMDFYGIDRQDVLHIPIKIIKNETVCSSSNCLTEGYDWVYDICESQLHQSNTENSAFVTGFAKFWGIHPISYTFGNQAVLI